jgi:PEP-CTERM motif
MKSLKRILVMSLTTASILLASTAAKADGYPLTITLDEPFQAALNAGTFDFTGTIVNTSGSTVNLGGDSFTLNGPLSANDDGFNNNAPFTLSASGTSGDIDLFTITIAPGTATGLYTGVFDILDGNTVVGQVDFDVDLTPEPGTLLLLGTGLLALAGLARWRLPKNNNSMTLA